jgi:hypothetical protein
LILFLQQPMHRQWRKKDATPPDIIWTVCTTRNPGLNGRVFLVPVLQEVTPHGDELRPPPAPPFF